MKKLYILSFISLIIIIASGCISGKPTAGKEYEIFEQDDFTVIKTKAENIKPETIRETKLGSCMAKAE